MQRSPMRRSKRNQSECPEPASQSSYSTAKIAATSAKARGQPSALPCRTPVSIPEFSMSHSTTPPPVATSSSAPMPNTEPASQSSTSFTPIRLATKHSALCPKAGSSSATLASGMQLDTPDRTHGVSEFTSHPIHASINSGSSALVGASANVSLASGEFASANATTTIMPTATVNASAPSNMDMLYKMQQQISMLEQQLKYAQAHISES
ncbi:unnamed protein product [Ceratitis capitata]|uniref:(Mediterranean fruit fly) hypothetical protein n=1 Tax=Ceratitis capitata TaxID=7213 RepID=A0A811UVI7_CERCA|nr:unnamed protein product [Ceratitis capitata]